VNLLSNCCFPGYGYMISSPVEMGGGLCLHKFTWVLWGCISCVQSTRAIQG